MATKLTLALDALAEARKHIKDHVENGEEEVEPVPLQFETGTGALITATPNGNCLDIECDEYHQLNFRMSEDSPGSKMWIWLTRKQEDF